MINLLSYRAVLVIAARYACPKSKAVLSEARQTAYAWSVIKRQVHTARHPQRGLVQPAQSRMR